MSACIIVHESFERTWSWAADYWRAQWEQQFPNQLSFLRCTETPPALADSIPAETQYLAILGLRVESADLKHCTQLTHVCAQQPYYHEAGELKQFCQEHGIQFLEHRSEGFWGQSVAEFGLALTLCGLRRIPQTHASIRENLDEWNYHPEIGKPQGRCGQFGDDPNFVNGTLCGKKVRIVGAGNISTRYADWCSSMGADVVVWDPFASEPCFHRSGSRRVFTLEELMHDADIFAPMLPLTPETEGIVTAEMIEALPHGCLVVQVTRANICDTETLYRRVLNNELALAADVFDVEPVPLDSPLLGRANVVHTPHNAGRTKEANWAWVDALLFQCTYPQKVKPGTASVSLA